MQKKTYISPLFESILPQCDVMDNEWITGSKSDPKENGTGENDFSKNSGFYFDDDFVDGNSGNYFDE